MVVIIPLLNGSRNNYFDLKHALRSFDKWLNPDRIILVGGKPDWFKGEHIPHPDYFPVHKEKNIFDKLKAGADVVNGEFMFCNDDHFLLAPYQGLLHKGRMDYNVTTYSDHGSYRKTLENTMTYFNRDIEDYGIHYPMLMTTEGVNKIQADWRVQYGYEVKTMYCYTNHEYGKFHPDLKLNHIPKEINRLFFSTSDICDNSHKVLPLLFPDKSKFEV
jgi:hypothetical protein